MIRDVRLFPKNHFLCLTLSRMMAYISVLLVALAVTASAAAIAPTIEAGPGGIVVQFGTCAVCGLLSSSTI